MRTLYTFFRSSTSFRLRIALNYKGLDYTPQFVSLPKLEHREPAYMALNPQGLLPALIEDGKLYAQSLAILEYLEERYPMPPLMPRDIDERAYVRMLSQIVGCDIHPLNNVRVLKYLRGRWKLSEEQSNEWYAHWIAEGMRSFEQTLAHEKRHGLFCLGDTPTIADICLASIIAVMRIFKIEVPSIPTVLRVMAACEQLDAFAKADPSRQAGAPQA